MIVLGGTTEVLRARLATAPAATNPTFLFAYGDDGGAPVLGGSHGALNGNTAVTLVGSPASGVQRAIHSGTLYNADSAAVTITVEHYDGTTARTVTQVTLAAGYTLELTANGWRTLDDHGGTGPGPEGPQGIPGDAGAAGPAGAPGQIRFTGYGAPGTIVGSSPYDVYLDLNTGTTYRLE